MAHKNNKPKTIGKWKKPHHGEYRSLKRLLFSCCVCSHFSSYSLTHSLTSSVDGFHCLESFVFSLIMLNFYIAVVEVPFMFVFFFFALYFSSSHIILNCAYNAQCLWHRRQNISPHQKPAFHILQLEFTSNKLILQTWFWTNSFAYSLYFGFGCPKLKNDVK